jgi:hypothetical protein
LFLFHPTFRAVRFQLPESDRIEADGISASAKSPPLNSRGWNALIVAAAYSKNTAGHGRRKWKKQKSRLEC